MSDELLEGPEGVSRRSMLKKSALVGGTMVWAAPVVQSITSPAFAQGTPDTNGGTQDISFVAMLLDCSGSLYRIKFNDGNVANPEYGQSFSVAQCNTQLGQDDPNVVDAKPTGVTATENADGSWTVNLGTCTLVDYVVKCGSKAYQDPNADVNQDAEGDFSDQGGCQDYPEDVNAPSAPEDGIVVFYPCSTTAP